VFVMSTVGIVSYINREINGHKLEMVSKTRILCFTCRRCKRSDAIKVILLPMRRIVNKKLLSTGIIGIFIKSFESF
jgi:hypothetical protein